MGCQRPSADLELLPLRPAWAIVCAMQMMMEPAIAHHIRVARSQEVAVLVAEWWSKRKATYTWATVDVGSGGREVGVEV